MTPGSSKMIGERKKYQRKKKNTKRATQWVGYLIMFDSIYCILRGKQGVIRAKLNISWICHAKSTCLPYAK